VCLRGRSAAVSEPTYYRWRKEYGGLKLDQAKRLKQLEGENARLKACVHRMASSSSATVRESSSRTQSTFERRCSRWPTKSGDTANE
jgi:hypothetical protein